MLVETNRLHQKIKRLKEELAKEKEMRKEAERQLKVLKEHNEKYQEKKEDRNWKLQHLELTEPTNIGLVIRCYNYQQNQEHNDRLRSTQNENNESNAKKTQELAKLPELDNTTSKQEVTHNAEIPANKKDDTTEVMNFFIHFSKMIAEQNELEIEKCYNKGVEIRNCSVWPDYTFIESKIGTGSEVFLVFYKELYHRQNSGQCPESWKNYQDLFSKLISSQDQNSFISLSLPDIWVWDIIDEFVYQFQTYTLRHMALNNFKNKTIWNKELVIETLSLFYTKSLANNSDLFLKFGYFSFIGLLRLYTFFENHQATLKLIDQCLIEPKHMENIDLELRMKCRYEIGFSHLMMGKLIEAANVFLEVLRYTKKIGTEEEKEKLSGYKINSQRCIAFCISHNPKIKKNIPKNIGSTIENIYKTEIEEWKDGKIETFWNFFSECSPAIQWRNSSNNPEWKTKNLKTIKQCLQRVTMWKPMRNLKGLLKIVEILPFETIPKSILPVTTDSDIKYFCENHIALQRLITVKTSGVQKVLRDFPEIYRKETLILLIMQYHKILQKQKNEEKIMEFGRKFDNLLKKMGTSGKISAEDSMCYIEEVAKISMDAANHFVENLCKY